MVSPRMSICIPTRNRRDLLVEALTSALSQSEANIEVVVSNNCSTDGTQDYLSRVGDERLRVLRSASHIPAAENYNRAIAASHAAIVMVLADDDLIDTDFVAEMLRRWEFTPHASMIHSAYRLIDHNRFCLRQYVHLRDPDRAPSELGAVFINESMRRGLRINLSATTFRRDLLPPVPFHPADGVADDLGLSLRMARKGPVEFVDEALVSIRQHAGATNQTQRGNPSSASSNYSLDWSKQFLDAKMRFIYENRNDPQATHWQRWARASYRKRLLAPAAEALTQGRPRETMRRIVDAHRRDPWVWRDGQAWKWAFATVLAK